MATEMPIKDILKESDSPGLELVSAPVRLGDKSLKYCIVFSRLARKSIGCVPVCHMSTKLSPVKMPLPSQAPFRYLGSSSGRADGISF